MCTIHTCGDSRSVWNRLCWRTLFGIRRQATDQHGSNIFMTSRSTASLGETKRSALRASALLGGNLLLLVACGGGEAVTTNPAATTPTTTNTAGKPAATATAGSGVTATTPAATATAGAKATTPAATGTGGTAATTTTTPAVTTPTAAAGSSAATAGTTATAAAGTMATATAGTSAAAGGGATESPTTPGGGPLEGESKCLADITTYDKAGPFEYDSMRQGSINFWVPKVPAGCKVPVIHLANGTGASCSNYAASLTRFASYGFLACCYENTNTGAGTQGLEALKTAVEKFPDLAAKRFGSTGHSQGGQASFVVLQFAEAEFGPEGTYAGLAMQPASGFGTQPQGGWQNIYKKIKSPMFMFSGQGTDGLVSQSWVLDAFNNLDKGIEAYFWAKQGGQHIPVPNGEETQIGPAWFRWKLLGDKKACEYFKSIPETDKTWEVVKSQNVKECM